jgi:drug/metabolite transporter (DMT)-like permease
MNFFHCCAQYLTLWSLVIFILDVYCNLVYLNTLILALMVSIIGAYITYGIKELNFCNVKIVGAPLIVGDIIFHQLPLLYMIYNHTIYFNKYSKIQTFYTLVFVSVYYVLVDIYKVYPFHKDKKRFRELLILLMFMAVACMYLMSTGKRENWVIVS